MPDTSAVVTDSQREALLLVGLDGRARAEYVPAADCCVRLGPVVASSHRPLSLVPQTSSGQGILKSMQWLMEIGALERVVGRRARSGGYEVLGLLFSAGSVRLAPEPDTDQLQLARDERGLGDLPDLSECRSSCR